MFAPWSLSLQSVLQLMHGLTSGSRAKQRGEDGANDLSEDDDDDANNNDRSPTDEDGDFELDDIDLSSPFFRNMVSERPLVPNFTGLIAPIVATHLETNRNATAEEWENMQRQYYLTFLTVSNIVRNPQAVRIESNIHTPILC